MCFGVMLLSLGAGFAGLGGFPIGDICWVVVLTLGWL